jgi:hypothetical protein
MADLCAAARTPVAFLNLSGNYKKSGFDGENDARDVVREINFI